MNIVSGTIRLWYSIKDTGTGSTAIKSIDTYRYLTENISHESITRISPVCTLRKSCAAKWLYFFVSFTAVSSLALFGFTLFGCQNTGQVCAPQYSFEITDHTSASKTIVKALNDLVHAFTFLAQEYGPESSENDSLTLFTNNTATQPQLESIKTFMPGTHFDLGMSGYCCTTDSTNCSGGVINGIDIAATLIRDFGIQLARITNQDEPKSVADALVLGYEMSLHNIATYSKQKGNFNMKSAIVIKNLSKAVPLLCWICMILQIFILCNSSLGYKFTDRGRDKTATYLIGVTILIMIVVVTVVGIYVVKLQQVLTADLGLALLKFGAGYFLLVAILVTAVLQQVLQFMLLAQTKATDCESIY